MFKKATKAQAKARLLFSGASGSGKTTAALTVASELGSKIAFIDTEAGSASLYADRFNFDVLEMGPPYSPERFTEAIEAAEQAGYDVVIIDSITHEWSGPGGCLDIKTKMGDRFQDWAKVTPRHDRFIQSMMRSKAHIIATVRAKQGYSMDEKGKVQKSGMDPQQRDGIDFEFTVCWNINAQHMAEAQKDRTRLFDGKPEVITAETGKRLKDWLTAGKEPEEQTQEAPVNVRAVIRQHNMAKSLVPQLLEKLGKQTLDDCTDAELVRIKNYLEAKEVAA
ncbi:AAA domain containing protein [uncultured Caudovirales phage]|jgi:DNA polymerase III delta prime subunit|uniref:AAA domain containing protein n=1 Tax=uncultured Caudovirales phage TaxID=2100421 RepID=A0A6J5N8N5_9CAUD|nr:AAA domain containing protein [uncultured Caudovirales phage]